MRELKNISNLDRRSGSVLAGSALRAVAAMLIGVLLIPANFHLIAFSAEPTPSYYFEQLAERQGDSVTLQDITVETMKYNDYYKSTVHLTLQNKGHTAEEHANDPYLIYYSQWNKQQYSTSFLIPDGVFVSNYYLDIEGTRKYGLLAERNSALWIYSSVVSRAMDPGLVYYEGKYLTLRVFPFSDSETRYTGIEFLHKGPVTLQIDGHPVRLAPEAETSSHPQPVGDRAIYLSADSKNALPVAHRNAHYVFVADCAESSDVAEIAARIRSFCSEHNIVRNQATIYATNDKSKAIPMTDQNWQQTLLGYNREGSFDLGAAINAVVRKHNTQKTYPVIIAVRSEQGNSGVTWPKTTTSLAQRIPEIEGYFVLTGNSLTEYIFDSRQNFAVTALPKPIKTVSAEIDGQTYWMRDDGQPEILMRDTPATRQSAPQGEWEQAVALMARYRRLGKQSQSRQPEMQIDLVRSSFAAQVLLPVTSFITLETEEQETRLLNFQKKLLGSGDIEEEYSERQDDSMYNYDESDDEDEEPDDEDGSNPATGGDGSHANPSTGGVAETAQSNSLPVLCLLWAAGIAVIAICQKTRMR